MRPQVSGLVTAAALVGRVSTVGPDAPATWELLDEVRDGDEVREVLVSLAAIAAGYAQALADLHGQPVATVLDRLAGEVADTVKED